MNLSRLPDPPPDSRIDSRGKPPRVVLDTSVVVTALMFGGGPAARLREAWQSGHCRPMVCKATMLDLGANLAHPHLGLLPQEQRQLLGDYLPYTLKVRVAQADADAAPDGATAAMAFVRLSMAGKAHALVTGDATLLALGSKLHCPVLALNHFIDQLDRMAITPLPRRSRF
jgi:predicted nucleic acid-binding protein